MSASIGLHARTEAARCGSGILIMLCVHVQVVDILIYKGREELEVCSSCLAHRQTATTQIQVWQEKCS